MNSLNDRSKLPLRPILLVALAALVIRGIYLWIYAGLPEWSMLTVDNWYHHNLAQVFADGNLLGDTTFFRAPFYIWSLGLLYALFGSSIWVGRLFGLIVGVGSVFLTGRIGQRLFSTRVGSVAGLLHACYPIAIYFDLELLLDPLFTLLVQLTILQFLRWWDAPSPIRIGLTGLLLGLASITRPTALVFLPVILTVVLIKRDSHFRVRQVVLLLAGLVLMIAPITIRNMVVGGEPVLIASQAGINLYIGNNEASDGQSAVMPQPYGHNWQIADISLKAEQAAGHSLKPGGVSSYWTGRALDWMIEQPTAFIGLYLKRVYFFFANNEPSNNRNIASFFGRVPLLGYNPLSFGILLTLSVLGVVAHWRDNRAMRVLVALVLVYILAAALFFMNGRFRLPLLPIFFVCGSAGLWALGSWLRWNPTRAMPTMLLALVLGLSSYLDLFSQPKAIPTTSLSRGSYYFQQGDLERALESFRQAQAVNPAYAEVNLNLGAVFLRAGKADSADTYFQREIAEHPHRVKGYTNLASLYLVSDRIEEARNLATQAITIRPFDQNAWLLLVRAMAVSPDSIEAMLPELAGDALVATDTNVFVANELAAALSQFGDRQSAEAILRAAMESPPPPVEMNDDAFTREFATGPEAWEKATAGSYYQLGYLQGLRGRFGQALEYTSEAIRRDSSLVAAWLNLASAYRAIGRPNAADSVIQSALDRFGADELNRHLPPASRP